MVPNNYNGPIPAGLYKSSMGYATQVSPPKDDFAPRVGFAWQPTSSGRWVVRGGAGYFYDLAGRVGCYFIADLFRPRCGLPHRGLAFGDSRPSVRSTHIRRARAVGKLRFSTAVCNVTNLVQCERNQFESLDTVHVSQCHRAARLRMELEHAI